MAQGFDYDGVDLTEYGWNVRLTGASFAMPGRRGQNVVTPGKDGRTYVRKPLEQRQETLVMWVRDEQSSGGGSSEANLLANLDILRALFGKAGQHELGYTVGGVRRVAQAEVVEKFEFTPDAKGRANVYGFAVMFTLADPCWYAETATTFGPERIGTTSDSFTINNPGTYEVTKAVITITGEITDPQLTIGSVWVKWTGTVGAAQALVIDCSAFTAELDESDASDGITHSDPGPWLPIPSGDSTLEVASASVSGAAVTVEFVAAHL
jgi:hypothetical protein